MSRFFAPSTMILFEFGELDIDRSAKYLLCVCVCVCVCDFALASEIIIFSLFSCDIDKRNEQFKLKKEKKEGI